MKWLWLLQPSAPPRHRPPPAEAEPDRGPALDIQRALAAVEAAREGRQAPGAAHVEFGARKLT